MAEEAIEQIPQEPTQEPWWKNTLNKLSRIGYRSTETDSLKETQDEQERIESYKKPTPPGNNYIYQKYKRQKISTVSG